MPTSDEPRSPGRKMLTAILVGLALSIPLFTVWLLVYDRQNQHEEALTSIAEGWGGPQVMQGPVLVIPYKATRAETDDENGKSVTRTRIADMELTLDPAALELGSAVKPEPRKRSIYEEVVYSATTHGAARFALPDTLASFGVDPAALDLAHAQLRFGLSDQKGLGADPVVTVAGRPVRLQPGAGDDGKGGGFFAFVDMSGLRGSSTVVVFDYVLQGSQSLSLAPRGGRVHWRVDSPWQHPSFVGNFLPGSHALTKTGFVADYNIGNLSLGRTLVTTGPKGTPSFVAQPDSAEAAADLARAIADGEASPQGSQPAIATVNLIQPVDLYSRVDRAVKYGFLFIGFTFLALLMFDVIGGVVISSVEYLLMGAALVLFFVLLLAFAEVIGFGWAYALAASAIAGLNTAYSAAVLGSWTRGYLIGGLLTGLFVALYVLLGLEALALLIGSVMLFLALAATMYITRRVNWGGSAAVE